MNVYIYDEISNSYGFAPNPITSQFLGAFSPLDGIVVSKSVLGDESGGSNFGLFPGFNEGKILVHEVGHYLFLLHTFQGGCSSPGDFCSDTQPCNGPQSNNPNFLDCDSDNPYEGCALGFDQKNNHMNYSFDECKNSFTELQIARMNTFLTTQRSSLISNENMITSGINLSLSCNCADNFLVSSFTNNNTQNQFCENIIYTFTNFNNIYNSASRYDWEVVNILQNSSGGVNIIGLTTNSSLVIKFDYGSVYRIKLTVTDNNGNESVSTKNIRVRDCSGPTPISDNSKANWYFGQMAKIDFSSGNPQVGIAACTYPHLNVSEAVESVSDANGNLLFYTDGYRFWNHNEQLINSGLGEIIPNMSEINTKSVSQKALIKHLGYENRYFIISPPERTLWEEIPHIYRIPGYKQINTTDLNNLIVSNMQPVIPDGYFNPPSDNIKFFSELITYIPTCNNTGWLIYVLMNDTKPANQNNCRIAAQKVYNGGLETTMIYSDAFNWSYGTAQLYPSFGAIKCSPDGRRLVIGGTNYVGSTPKGRLCVLDFNPESGLATNPVFISENSQLPGSLDGSQSYYFYSPSFAPNNSNLIYCAVPASTNEDGVYTLLKFNLFGNTSYCSTFLNEVNGSKCYSLQTGPDDIMYVGSRLISTSSNESVVSSIYNADNSNAAIFVNGDLNFTNLNPVCAGYQPVSGMVRAKLPNFSDFKGDAQLSDPTIYYLLTSCSEAIFDVQPLPTCAQGSFSFYWLFGDGSLSTEQNPTHYYSAAGNYNVSVTITNANLVNPIILNTVITIIDPISIAIVQTPNGGTIIPGGTSFFTTNPVLNNQNIQYSWTVIGGNIAGVTTGNAIEVIWDTNLSTDGIVNLTYVSGLCTGTVSSSFYSGPCDIGANVFQTDRSCEYAPILTAEPSGGTEPYSYVWQNSNGVNVSSTINLDMSDLENWTNNVNLIVTDANGCSATISVEVSGFVTDLQQFPNSIDPTTSLSGTYYMQGQVSILPGNGGTSYFSSINIIALPNSSIKLEGGAKLQISGTHIYSCKKMWKGIDAKKGDQIVLSRNSLIEDAEIGVYLKGGCQYEFNNSTFNLNGTAIKIETSALGQSQAKKIENMVFTRHNFVTQNWGTNLNIVANDWFVTLASNSSPANLTGLTIDALKPTVNGTVLRTLGIEVINTLTIIIGDESNLSNNNIFEGLDNGVLIKGCNTVRVVNNTFSRICRKWLDANGNNSSFGTAINAVYKESFTPTEFNSYTALFIAGDRFNNTAKNTILNCTAGIKAKNFTEVKINNNFFECTKSVYNGPVSPNTRITGEDAIVVSTVKSAPSFSTTGDYSRGISYNTIKVFKYGITFNTVYLYNYSNENVFYISNNSIKPNFINAAGFISNAVVWDGIKLISNLPPELTPHRTYVRNNSILRVMKNGISVANYKRAYIENNNDLTLFARPTSNGADLKTAINVSNSTSIQINGNCNVGIDGADNQNLSNYNNINKYRGLRLSNSTNCWIGGNTFKNLGTCMRFEAYINSPNTVSNNKMANAQIGIYLNNIANLGQQALNSDPNRGSNNVWVTTGPTPWLYAGFAETGCQITLSPFAFKTSSGFESALGGTRNPTYNGNSLNYLLGIINQSSNYINFTGCGSGGNPPPGGYVYFDTNLVDIDEEQMEEIIDNINTGQYENQEADLFYFKKQNYNHILQDSSVLQNPIIAEYYASLLAENVGKIADIEKELSRGEFASAYLQNVALSATSDLELKHKFANQENYKLYKLSFDSTFTDSANLEAIKELALNPLYENTGVGTMAKSLYINYFMQNVAENPTDDGNARFAEDANEEIENNINEIFAANLMPNPADNSLTLVMENSNATIEVFDMQSRLLLQIKTLSNTTNINTQAWSQGVYTFKIRTDSNVSTKKVVIKH